jgi:chromosome segregation ATPase
MLRIDVATKNKEIENKIERINELHNDIAARDGIIGDLNKQMKSIYQRQKTLLQSLQDSDGTAILSNENEKKDMQNVISDLQSQIQDMEKNRSVRTSSMKATATQSKYKFQTNVNKYTADEELIIQEDRKRRESVLEETVKPYDDHNDYLFVEAVREKDQLKYDLQNKQREIEQIRTNTQQQKQTLEKKLQQQIIMHNQTKDKLRNLLDALKKKENEKMEKVSRYKSTDLIYFL